MAQLASAMLQAFLVTLLSVPVIPLWLELCMMPVICLRVRNVGILSFLFPCHVQQSINSGNVHAY